MAKIIEFNIPQRFRKAPKWLPPNERGKLLEFPVMVGTSAWPISETNLLQEIRTADVSLFLPIASD